MARSPIYTQTFMGTDRPVKSVVLADKAQMFAPELFVPGGKPIGNTVVDKDHSSSNHLVILL